MSDIKPIKWHSKYFAKKYVEYREEVKTKVKYSSYLIEALAWCLVFS